MPSTRRVVAGHASRRYRASEGRPAAGHRALCHHSRRQAVRSAQFLPLRVRATVTPEATPRAQHRGTAPLRFYRSATWPGAPRRGLRRTTPLTGWDGGLLLTAHPRCPLRCQRLGVCVEIEHRQGRGHTGRLRRGLPGVIAPGGDRVRTQPGTACPRRDGRHHLLLDGHLDELRPRPARPGFAGGAWRPPGPRGPLGPRQRGAGAAGAGPRCLTHTGGLRPARSPGIDGLDAAAPLPRAISACRQGGCGGASRSSRARWTAANEAV